MKKIKEFYNRNKGLFIIVGLLILISIIEALNPNLQQNAPIYFITPTGGIGTIIQF